MTHLDEQGMYGKYTPTAVVTSTSPALPSSPVGELVERLRGIYRIPITDGLGPAGGEEPDNPNEFVRQFETSPIQHEAASALTTLSTRNADLEREVKRLREAVEAADKFRALFVCDDAEPASLNLPGEISNEFCQAYDEASTASMRALSTSPQGGEHE